MWRVASWFPNLKPEVLNSLKEFHSELLKFTTRLNLISKNTEREADEVHFADCILAATSIPSVRLGKRVFDVGSGNGLPGIVMALLNPGVEFYLVESDIRKSEFLKHIVSHLKLDNVGIMNVRLESLEPKSISCAITRGFASISKTCLVCNKIFVKDGACFHLKGSNWSREVADLPSQLIAHWSPQLVGEYSLPVSQARRGVVCTVKIQ